MIIEYDGTNYHGWQRQSSRDSDAGDLHKTIQGTIEKALSVITKHSVKVTAAGRTDAGVHAAGQVINFKTTLNINESSWVKAINSLLPEDIAAKNAEYVMEGFNARFDAKSKVYKYIILDSLLPSPFHRNNVWRIKKPLNIYLMREALQYLIGHHDFSSFRASDCSAKSPYKTLNLIEIDEVSLENSPIPAIPVRTILFTFEARSFLQHMVRNIVGTLAEVGRGKITPHDIYDIMEKRDRRYAGPIAPPQGLYLSEVRY